jgi:hypothetical protein
MMEEDVFPVTRRIEIACIDNKLSPMMLLHTTPDRDGPSTSKSIPLLSTGLGVTLIPSTMKVNLTITHGETKPGVTLAPTVQENCGLLNSVANVSKTFKHVNSRKITSCVLRACTDQLAGAFTDKFNLSLSQSVVHCSCTQMTITQ